MQFLCQTTNFGCFVGNNIYLCGKYCLKSVFLPLRKRGKFADCIPKTIEKIEVCGLYSENKMRQGMPCLYKTNAKSVILIRLRRKGLLKNTNHCRCGLVKLITADGTLSPQLFIAVILKYLLRPCCIYNCVLVSIVPMPSVVSVGKNKPLGVSDS